MQASNNNRIRTIVVWFSCGAASAVAAKKTIEKYGDVADIRIVNNVVDEEDSDNRRFLKDVEQWLGHPIEICGNSNLDHTSARKIWEKASYMGGIGGAPCTTQLKRQARQQWEEQNFFTDIVMGFTLNEIRRHKTFVTTERSNVIPILIDEGLIKNDCFDIIQQAGIELPRIYRMGYPNANCIGCIKASSPTYWNHVRKMHPKIFEDRARMSREIGAKLVRFRKPHQKHLPNPPRQFLDDLPPELMGRVMKNLPSFDCGIFCEEKSFNDNDVNKTVLDEAS